MPLDYAQQMMLMSLGGGLMQAGQARPFLSPRPIGPAINQALRTGQNAQYGQQQAQLFQLQLQEAEARKAEAKRQQELQSRLGFQMGPGNEVAGNQQAMAQTLAQMGQPGMALSLLAPPQTGKDFTLSPGSVRFGSTGKPIADVPAAPPKPTENQRQVEALQSQFGLPYQEAWKVANGMMRVTTDPVTGQSRIVDLVSGEGRTVSSGGVSEPVPEVSRETRGTILDDLSAFGAWASFEDFKASTIGQFAPDTVDDAVIRSRQRVRNLRENVISAMKQSSRPPVIEQKRLLEMIPSLGPLESPARAAVMLDELGDMLRKQVQRDKEALRDPGISKAERSNLGRRTRETQDVIAQIGVMPPDFEAPATPIPEMPSLPNLFSGAEPALPVGPATPYPAARRGAGRPGYHTPRAPALFPKGGQVRPDKERTRLMKKYPFLEFD